MRGVEKDRALFPCKVCGCEQVSYVLQPGFAVGPWRSRVASQSQALLFDQEKEGASLSTCHR